MGFLHLGWDIAAKEGASDHLPGDYNSAWSEVAKHVDLARPGMAAVIRTMGWQPLHLAAMEGKVSLVKTLVQQLGCNILGRSANSWTPMHYAAAHNQVRCCKGLRQRKAYDNGRGPATPSALTLQSSATQHCLSNTTQSSLTSATLQSSVP